MLSLVRTVVHQDAGGDGIEDSLGCQHLQTRVRRGF